MATSTAFKRVVVKEDPKTTLRAATIHPLSMKNGQKVVAIGHLYWPYHDRSMFDTVLKYLQDEKPDLVICLGGMVAESAFKNLDPLKLEDNYLHDHPEVPEVLAALDEGRSFEGRVRALADSARANLFERLQEASGGFVVWTPSWTHLSMENEVRLTEWIQSKKRFLDGIMSNKPESPDIVSNPKEQLPKDLTTLFGLQGNPQIKVLRHGAGVEINKELLFMIGDFRRRNAGDASYAEWEQRGKSIVRSFDGKVASMWFTSAKHTQPGLRMRQWQCHEVGHLWDPIHMSHFRDYDRRAPGFWTGRIVHGHVIGKSIYVLRGRDGRRSFVVHGKPYTENEPGSLSRGETLIIPSKDAVLGTRAGMSSRPATPLTEADEPAVLGTAAGKSSTPAVKRAAKKTAKAKAKAPKAKKGTTKGKRK